MDVVSIFVTPFIYIFISPSSQNDNKLGVVLHLRKSFVDQWHVFSMHNYHPYWKQKPLWIGNAPFEKHQLQDSPWCIVWFLAISHKNVPNLLPFKILIFLINSFQHLSSESFLWLLNNVQLSLSNLGNHLVFQFLIIHRIQSLLFFNLIFGQLLVLHCNDFSYHWLFKFVTTFNSNNSLISYHTSSHVVGVMQFPLMVILYISTPNISHIIVFPSYVPTIMKTMDMRSTILIPYTWPSPILTLHTSR